MSDAKSVKALENWLTSFERTLASKDVGAVTEHFAEECYWRDIVAFTWDIATVEGKADIAAMLKATLEKATPYKFAIEGGVTELEGVIESSFTFETATARGTGYVRLRDGKCWTLLTTAHELKGFEEPSGKRRDNGAPHGLTQTQRTWLERKNDEEAELGYSKQPYCVIIGGGQGGIILGARLKRLGVPTIIVERNERPGDSWRKRYKSLCLHDPVWYDHLPYIPFPDHWPVYCPKDKIGDWLEMYTKIMELNYWGSTECTGATFDEAKQEWVVSVERNGKKHTLRPKQLVFSTGVSGLPNAPKFPGADHFEGEQYHSSAYVSGEPYRGKKCVVIGSNNSSHDICADLWQYGADVTMVQRSSTHVSRATSLMEILDPLYSENALKVGMTPERADLLGASIPYRLLAGFHKPIFDDMAKKDAPFYDRLKKAGFLLDFGEDGSGLLLKYVRRGSGYYIDVGASDLIADGKIKLKSGAQVKAIKARSIEFDDGTSLPADLIVYATGYGSMDGRVAEVISPEVAKTIGQCWGLGSATTRDPGPWEGELRNMWKPTRQKAFWVNGGNLQQARYYSQFLAIQLKARMEGIPVEVYRK